jgi:hypothetical protein
MKKRLLLVLALVVALSLLAAAPVSADKPLRGDIDHEYVGCETPDGRWMTFVGPIDFDGDIYEMAFFNTGVPKIAGNSYHFTEDWEIYATPVVDCTPGDVVAWGYDSGVINLRNLKGVANGQVVDVNPDGLFTESLIGSNVHWNGVNDATYSYFDATFRINS